MNADGEFVRLLRALAQAVDKFGVADVSRLLEARLQGPGGRRRGPKPRGNPDTDPAVLARLTQCQTREEVQAILAQVENRERLVTLARELRIHVQKGDARPLIEQKIAEAVVGRRLGREAIRSLDLGSGGVSPSIGSTGDRPSGEHEPKA